MSDPRTREGRPAEADLPKPSPLPDGSEHRSTVRHGARWTPALLEAMFPIDGDHVHDPFAGTGERLGALCDARALTFTGTEIEPAFIVDARVKVGDSTLAETYPTDDCVIVTSPVYPNGCTDHFKATDIAGRNTYRAWNALNEGADRELHPSNMGRYGYRYGKKSRDSYWTLAAAAVRHWPNTVIVNMKDMIAKGEIIPVVDQWVALLEAYGYRLVERRDVTCPGNRFGENRAARVDTESLLLAVRS